MDIRSHLDRYCPLNWSLRYRVMLFLVLALVLMPAVIFAASDIFTDVPDSNFAHNAINAIYGARITVGTAPGLYGPGVDVTREQVAAFLHRGLPRVAYNTGTSILTSTEQDLAVVTIKTGGAPGGTGFVKLDASFLGGNASDTGCPCVVQFYIRQDGDVDVASFNHYTTFYDSTQLPGSTSGGSVVLVVKASTASTLTFRLKVRLYNGTAQIRGFGELSALYVPFGHTGGDTLFPE